MANSLKIESERITKAVGNAIKVFDRYSIKTAKGIKVFDRPVAQPIRQNK